MTAATEPDDWKYDDSIRVVCPNCGSGANRTCKGADFYEAGFLFHKERVDVSKEASHAR